MQTSTPTSKTLATRPVLILGAGAMGTGIAQISALRGHTTYLYDTEASALERAQASLKKVLARQVEKGRMTRELADAALGRIVPLQKLSGEPGSVGLVIEAVIEELSAKQALLGQVEELVRDETLLATNTSSLSVTAIASACRRPERVLGVHFFNPAPLMALVEIVSALQTERSVADRAQKLVDGWGKTTVRVADTPGFIVNRVARPFYGEALRLLEEGVANEATIDWAMRELGGFRMGPFELMDFIGNDINLSASQAVYSALYNDSRFKPFLQQQRLVEAGFLGRKSGRGHYRYDSGGQAIDRPEVNKDLGAGQRIVDRIVAMLINTAADAVLVGVASPQNVDLAMTRGVNYPRGLLAWADELGVDQVVGRLRALCEEYGEERYRPCVLLSRMARTGARFFEPNT